ncbi:S-adenosyl-L-methionine-dependent methyltransferase [Armillaria borealis]|uniref:S-adenosyl-L-methionine-dependent methyltransferase n=1 Tax=Armillaria borealis TaxID=47425 RepID=A0AA39JQU5_9AGAR|nr:S-adenosyl-L-methionine-dependent methyltransferase [Armillaria borealis]
MAEHHHHHHGHGHDFAEANKEHFNKDSHTYDELPLVKELTEKEGKYILSHGWSFDPESTTVLNFACGTGLLETTLIAHCKSIQGVDISQGMVDQYNKRAETLGNWKGANSMLSCAPWRTITLSPPMRSPAFLAYFLKPGGALLVTDRVSLDAVPKIEDIQKKYETIVPHKSGFSEEDMRKVFEGAGLESFSLNVIPGVTLDGMFGLTDQKLFLAKGLKPL